MKADIRRAEDGTRAIWYAPPGGSSRAAGYDRPIAGPPPVTHVRRDCYSFFSVSRSNRMTTLTASPVAQRRTDLFLLPLELIRCVGVFIAFWRPAAYGSAVSDHSDRRSHYLQTANIRTHYTKSQYMYESRGCRNNHLPLSVIPTAHVRWLPDDVGEPDCATTDGNENKLLPAEGYCEP